MAKLQIIPVGTKFNRLTYLGDAERKKVSNKSLRYCNFICDCGAKRVIKLSIVKNQEVKSCGCLNNEVRSIMTAKRNHVHGMAKINGKRNPTYLLLNNMKSRCYKENHIAFHNYGGRGISICDDWLKSPETFHDWCLNNGYEKGLEIDRIDVNGNYEPSNCRFVLPQVNQNNKRNNRYYTYNGETLTISQLASKYDISWSTLRSRLDYSKWDIERALTTPVKKKIKCRPLKD